jgi:uracil-DNA glycosylase
VVGQFPFGAPVLPCGTELPDRAHPVLVLGAYPSALHVRWTPPYGYGPAVAALPVDNEPTPFWDGDPGETQELFEAWHKQWFDPAWGKVTPAALNGASGRDLAVRWLQPLGYNREQAFITDCLPTARASIGVVTRLADRYAPVVTALGAPAAALGPHPSENDIVTEAAAEHVDRLTAQLVAADPELVVTLGNAAARVLAALGGQPDQDAVLGAETYGRERQVDIAGRTFRWQALVHPATPKMWADRHLAWAASL